MDTVLVTGATGFIGSELIKALKKNKEYNIVLLSSREIDGFPCVLHKGYTFSKQDFFDAGIMHIDYVIHAGAFTPKFGGNSNNTEECNSNIINTKYLMENIPDIRKKFIFLSTIDVYGVPVGVLNEDSPTLPQTLYGLSKLYCEKMLAEICKNRALQLQILRIGHIYGNGEGAYQKFIPVAIRSAKTEKAIHVFTEGKERRAFLHISDCCSFIVKTMELENDLGIINLTSSNSVSVLDIARLIAENSPEAVDIKVKGEAVTANDFIFDNTKREKLLGKEYMSLEEGLADEYRSL